MNARGHDLVYNNMPTQRETQSSLYWYSHSRAKLLPIKDLRSREVKESLDATRKCRTEASCSPRPSPESLCTYTFSRSGRSSSSSLSGSSKKSS